MPESFRNAVLPQIVNEPRIYCECPACGTVLPRGALAVVRGGNGYHDTYGARCEECGSRWFVEDSADFCEGPPKNRWIIDHKTRRVLSGVSSCCGGAYLCRCGGTIHRSVTGLDGATPTSLFVWAQGGPQFRVFWSCDSCDFKAETEDREYRP